MVGSVTTYWNDSWHVEARGTFVLKKVHTFILRDNIQSLSKKYIIRSSNLTIGEPFFENSSGGRSHFFCATARTLLLTGCSFPHRRRTTAGVYPRYLSSHLMSSHTPQLHLKVRNILIWICNLILRIIRPISDLGARPGRGGKMNPNLWLTHLKHL